jgi:hypothetical protein
MAIRAAREIKPMRLRQAALASAAAVWVRGSCRMRTMLTSHIVSHELAAVDPREPSSGMLRDAGIR